jgi:fibronectin-binding autotransporter adhesin
MPAAPGPPAPNKPNFGAAWDQLRERARSVGSIVALFGFLLLAGSAAGYFWSQAQKTPPPKAPTVQTLSQDDINKLSQVSSNLGTTGQTLNIGANSLFRGKVDIGGDLSIGGHLSANGPVTLSSLNITGTTAATGLNVGSNLNVSGVTTLQKGVSVTGLASVNGNLNVSGAASVGSLNAAVIAVRSLSISGPLTVGHLATQGPAPTIAANSVGGGGTVSISGNDTAGQININTGTSPGSTLATITFRAAFDLTVHVQLTPLTGPAAQAQTFITRNQGGFQIHANSAPGGSVLSYDYLVTQ